MDPGSSFLSVAEVEHVARAFHRIRPFNALSLEPARRGWHRDLDRMTHPLLWAAMYLRRRLGVPAQRHIFTWLHLRTQYRTQAPLVLRDDPHWTQHIRHYLLGSLWEARIQLSYRGASLII